MSSTGVSSQPGTEVGHGSGGQRRATSPEQSRDELIAAAAAQAPEIGDLIRLYYRHIPPEGRRGTLAPSAREAAHPRAARGAAAQPVHGRGRLDA